MDVLEERMQHIREGQAKQLAWSEPYVPGRFVPGGFSVDQRDKYHFDIYATRRPGFVQWYYEQNPDELVEHSCMDNRVQERAFCIRGEPGNIYLRDERWDQEHPHPRPLLNFPSVESAMAWIVATLMIAS